MAARSGDQQGASSSQDPELHARQDPATHGCPAAAASNPALTRHPHAASHLQQSPLLHPLQTGSKVNDGSSGSGWRTTKFHPYRSRPQIDSKIVAAAARIGSRAPAIHPCRLDPQIHNPHWWDRKVLPASIVEQSVGGRDASNREKKLVDSDAETDDENTISVVQNVSADAIRVVQNQSTNAIGTVHNQSTNFVVDDDFIYQLRMMKENFDAMDKGFEEMDVLFDEMGRTLERATGKKSEYVTKTKDGHPDSELNNQPPK